MRRVPSPRVLSASPSCSVEAMSSGPARPRHVLHGRATSASSGSTADKRAGGSEPGPGRARRAGNGEVGAARVPGAGRVRVSRGASGWHRVRDGARLCGLHQLCAPCSICGSGSRPQRDALETAFGLSARPPPDRFVVGLAVLGLLAEVAEEQPLLCVVDDAQWLDRASALTIAFVARRLLAESVGLVFAVRQPSEVRELDGLPELCSEGSATTTPARCWSRRWPGRLDEQVRDRVVAESRGNPLALLELPRGLTPAELAGGFGLPDATPLANRIEQSFLRQTRFASGRDSTAAADGGGRAGGRRGVLWRAAERLGLGRRRRGAGAVSRADRSRCTCAVPSPLGALGGLPGGVRVRPPGGAPRAGRGDRSRGRPRSARLASGARRFGSRRVRRRRARALGRARSGSRRHRGCGRVPRASRRADPGSGRSWPAGACRGPGQVRVGRAGGRARTSRGRGGVPAGRSPARAARTPARRDRLRAQTRQRRSAATSRRSRAARAT